MDDTKISNSQLTSDGHQHNIMLGAARDFKNFITHNLFNYNFLVYRFSDMKQFSYHTK
jgi:hypothetical protein